MSLDTAARIPFFIPHLEGRFQLTCSEDGFIFIDRDAESFWHILHYARTGQRPCRVELERQRYALLHECDFFGMEGLAFHLREQTCPFDLRAQDRVIREVELSGKSEFEVDRGLIDFFGVDMTPLPRDNLQLHLLLTASPRPSITNEYQVFYERLDAFSRHMMKNLARVSGAFVAGGAVVGPTFFIILSLDVVSARESHYFCRGACVLFLMLAPPH